MKSAPITVGITGAAGLIGNHTRVLLHTDNRFRVLPCDRLQFASNDLLSAFVTRCDAIVHLAGMNRGDEQEVARTNINLAKRLIEVCRGANKTPHIVFSSSTHVDKDTLYGHSKRSCSELFANWANDTGAKFTNLILPNIFGEGGRPFYNSVVSTFCHQLATGAEPHIEVDAELALMHAGRAAEIFREVLCDGRVGDERPDGTKVSVSEILRQLRELLSCYRDRIIPDLSTPMSVELFNTLRYELFKLKRAVDLTVHSDERGTLFESVRTLHGGQSFLSTTRPGITRGNHFHRRKFERFLVLAGDAIIRLRPLFTNNVIELIVTGKKPQYVDIPTLHTHSITNVGNTELVTQFWAHEIFNPTAPDTYPEPVLI